MSNILYIDTSSKDKTRIFLKTNKKKDFIECLSKKYNSQSCLIIIDEILRKNGLAVRDLSEIRVKKGSGSFTGLRVGVSIANALSFLLKIPVNDKKIGEYETAVYN